MGQQEGGHMTNCQKWYKTKVVALHCNFQNLFKLCSKVLLLWRYEVKDFEKHRFFFFFFFFCIFLNEQNTTKVGERLQKLVVSAFSEYKGL